ncbi:AAA family ATPase [Legionella drozanskii]|uniref:Sporulation initiation inhibitor protein Soj n=1 Tax=Legionella drozanskii LLAP-1 TaxID=1212489 RepID=A0A0W0SWE7_9GAMM|nr:AAA family ATPase [Legionella drozanskii]KTC87674.1 sporulation initiation inhibitor protein Soj [Legionella drozanskii LLAP-1]
MIILIGGEKGGTGKTTLATNIAATFAIKGDDILLVDTDPQKTASFWSLTRDEKNILPRVTTIQKFDNVKQEILALKNKFDHIIIDAGGRDSLELRTALLVADKAFFPLRASQFDLWTLAKINNHVSDAKAINENLRAFVLINQSSPNPSVKESDEASVYLEDFEELSALKTKIAERIAYRKAAIQGSCVQELDPEDKKATAEILSFYEEILYV